MLTDALANGGWVFLQNCHLSISWMPALEKIIESYCAASVAAEAAAKMAAVSGNKDHKSHRVHGAPHKKFRLWLSSSPHPSFPISVLQVCCHHAPTCAPRPAHARA